MRFTVRSIANLMKQGFNTKPWYLIFAITGLCNQRCAMCFYTKNISGYDPRKELTLDEIALIAQGFNNLFQLTLSGGEPLLRKDCLDIARVFAARTPVQRITLTSNGMMPEKIADFVHAFCSEFPRVTLSVNLSIDGLNEKHDKIRGVSGAFDRFLDSFDLLGSLAEKYKNVFRATATTISKINQGEVREILNYVEKRLDIASHGLMLARGDIPEDMRPTISVEEFSRLVFLLEAKKRSTMGSMSSAVSHVYQERRMRSLRQERMLDRCLAGSKLVVLSETGVLTPCELLEPLRVSNGLKQRFSDNFVFGDLRDFDYDVRKILMTEKAKSIKKFIRGNGCWCSFECAMINNYVLNPANYLRIAGRCLLCGLQ